MSDKQKPKPGPAPSQAPSKTPPPEKAPKKTEAPEKKEKGKEKAKEKTGMEKFFKSFEGYLVATGLNVDIMNLFKEHGEVMRSWEKILGFPITEWFGGIPTPTGINKWRKKYKKYIKPIPKAKKEKMKTKELTKEVKTVGEYMYDRLGLIAPVLPKPEVSKKKEKGKGKPKQKAEIIKNPHLIILIVQLDSSNFTAPQMPKAIMEAITKKDFETKKPILFMNDPVFFKVGNTYKGGFIRGFTKDAVIIKTFDKERQKEVLMEIPQKYLFWAFHMPGNKMAITGSKVEKRKKEDKGKKK